MKEHRAENGRAKWRTAVSAGLAAGSLLSAGWMAGLWLVSMLPAATEVSLTLAVSPWWRAGNWVSAGLVFTAIGGVTAALTACRPTTGRGTGNGRTPRTRDRAP